MLCKLYKTINLREKPSTKAKALCLVPMNKEINVTGKNFRWDKNIPYVSAEYGGKKGYINAKYIKGLVIKKKQKKGNNKYPFVVVLSNGKKFKRIKIVKQYSFNDYISKHGCSIVAIVEALECYDINKTPDEINTWCRSHLSGYNGSKVAIYGAYKAVKQISKKAVTYHSVTSKNKSIIKNKIKESLKAGKRVVIEQKNPIHTYVALGNSLSGKIVIATSGTVKEVTLNWIMKTILVGDGSKSDYFKGSKSDAGIFIV